MNYLLCFIGIFLLFAVVLWSAWPHGRFLKNCIIYVHTPVRCRAWAAGISTVNVNNAYCQTTVKSDFFPFSSDQIPFLAYRREQCCIRKSTNSQIPQCLCTSLHIWLINRLISNFLSSLWRGTIGTWEEIRWEAKWLL